MCLYIPVLLPRFEFGLQLLQSVHPWISQHHAVPEHYLHWLEPRMAQDPYITQVIYLSHLNAHYQASSLHG